MDIGDNTKIYEPTAQLCQRQKSTVTAFLLTQRPASKGIKIYGKKAEDAMLKEFCQLHDKGVLIAKNAKLLTTEQKILTKG
jgi:hypothetical protein